MYKTILVPIDVSKEELTDMVVDHVEMFAGLGKGDVHFIAVVPSLHSFLFERFSKKEADSQEKEIQAIASGDLAEMVEKFDLPNNKLHQHVAIGSAKDEILALAKKINADLIIVGSSSPDMTTYLIGSTAAAVVRHAETSVLVVR